QTESVCAGALGIQMGGTHRYHGVAVEKPTIGDRTREPQRADVARANVLMEITELLLAAVILGIAVPLLLI
ncbi:MAG: cobalamin biosynthesis protein, partial [Lachnospiraceae bacterium]|nr:cobalamin biosynthesis protein [Lachnospiraceae bacterium]